VNAKARKERLALAASFDQRRVMSCRCREVLARRTDPTIREVLVIDEAAFCIEELTRSVPLREQIIEQLLLIEDALDAIELRHG
jgi:hypothetical protein